MPPLRWQQVNVPVAPDMTHAVLMSENGALDAAGTFQVRQEWRLSGPVFTDANTTPVGVGEGSIFGIPIERTGDTTIRTSYLINTAAANNWISPNELRTALTSEYLTEAETTWTADAYRWNYNPVRNQTAALDLAFGTGYVYGDIGLAGTMWNGNTYNPNTYAPPTPEEVAAQAARYAAIDKQKKRAVRKAKKLLTEHLTDEQLVMLAEKDYFELESSSGRRYRIHRGHSRNILELNAAGQPVNRLCAHSRDLSMPDEDHILVQKLMLETDEAGFRRVANHSPIYIPSTPNIAIGTDITVAVNTEELVASLIRDLGNIRHAA